MGITEKKDLGSLQILEKNVLHRAVPSSGGSHGCQVKGGQGWMGVVSPVVTAVISAATSAQPVQVTINVKRLQCFTLEVPSPPQKRYLWLRCS